MCILLLGAHVRNRIKATCSTTESQNNEAENYIGYGTKCLRDNAG